MNKISVQDLSKGFGGTPLLQAVSFEAEEGEILGVLGASGEGKTTLLRCLANLEPLDSGTVTLGNESNPEKIKLLIGLVFQHCHLWPHLSVLDNLCLGPRHVLKHPKKHVFAEAHKLLETFGLAHKANCSPLQLSGGEQQRIAIARALMMNPKVILMDEPTSALDPERARDLVHILQLLVEKGVIVIIASHDLPFIQKAATRVLFFEKGKIIENTPVKTGHLQPTTQRFAQFLQGEPT